MTLTLQNEALSSRFRAVNSRTKRRMGYITEEDAKEMENLSLWQQGTSSPGPHRSHYYYGMGV